MIIKQNMKPFKIEDGKRFQMPVTIETNCPYPECKGKKVITKLSGDHYLSYPVANKPFKQLIVHETKNGDYHEYYVKLELQVTLVAAK